jgi:midasin (ATPase involved in ribosome maturation)
VEDLGSYERGFLPCQAVINLNISFPDWKELLSIFDAKKVETQAVIKELIGSNFFSVTIDHWTSISNENYSVITLHFICKFKLTTIVLSFERHKGGCTGEELQEQIFDSILAWQLPLSKFVACVTDSASNMNKMAEYITQKQVAHHYCADHIIQLSAEKAISSSSVVLSLQKLKNLVNHLNKSPSWTISSVHARLIMV